MNTETIEYKSGGIYKITNTLNNKVYIGQSLNTTSRLNSHKVCGKRGYGKKNEINTHPLYLDMFNQGLYTFAFDIIEEINVNKFDYQRIINEKEKYYIELYDSLSPNGYNRRTGGSYNCITSEESRKKISLSRKGHSSYLKGQTLSEETRQKISNTLKGRTLSEETKQKISITSKGKIISDKTKKKMSVANKGINNGMYGKKLTNEHKEKMSKSLTGKTRSDEIKNKISESLKGINNGMYGKKVNNEIKQKIKMTKTINMLLRIVNGEELPYNTKTKYKQYIDEYNLTGKIKYLEEHVSNNT